MRWPYLKPIGHEHGQAMGLEKASHVQVRTVELKLPSSTEGIYDKRVQGFPYLRKDKV